MHRSALIQPCKNSGSQPAPHPWNFKIFQNHGSETVRCDEASFAEIKLWATDSKQMIRKCFEASWSSVVKALITNTETAIMLEVSGTTFPDITWAKYFVTWNPDYIYDPNGIDRTKPDSQTDSPPDRWQTDTVKLIRLIRAFRQRSSGISLSLSVGSSASRNPPELSTFTSRASSACLQGSACITDLSHDSTLSKCACLLFYCSVWPDLLLLIEGVLWVQNKLDYYSICDMLLIVTDNNSDSKFWFWTKLCVYSSALSIEVYGWSTVECACIFVVAHLLIPLYKNVLFRLWSLLPVGL